MKTIVLGVGNPILRDDGVGIHVARKIKEKINNPNVVVDEAITGGMNLLDLMTGYDKAILIDAVNIKNENVGEVLSFPLSSLSTTHSDNPHDASLMEALELSKKLGQENIPKEIIVVGIVLKEIPYIFGEELSPEIAKAVPRAIDLTLNEIKRDMNLR